MKDTMTSTATFLSLMEAFETCKDKKQRKAILARVQQLAAANSATYVNWCNNPLTLTGWGVIL